MITTAGALSATKTIAAADITVTIAAAVSVSVVCLLMAIFASCSSI